LIEETVKYRGSTCRRCGECDWNFCRCLGGGGIATDRDRRNLHRGRDIENSHANSLLLVAVDVQGRVVRRCRGPTPKPPPRNPPTIHPWPPLIREDWLLVVCFFTNRICLLFNIWLETKLKKINIQRINGITFFFCLIYTV